MKPTPTHSSDDRFKLRRQLLTRPTPGKLAHLLGLVTLSVGMGVPAALADPTPASRPNVLFIAIDDLRPEIGAYGATQILTPHLDRFAAGAVRFDQAYCQVPVCGASRASLMTGVLPTPTRFVDFNTRVDLDTPGAVTLPQVFREAGYLTISNGKVFHHRNDTAARSWSETPWDTGGPQHDHLDPATVSHLSTRGRGRIYESPDVGDYAYRDGLVTAKTIADLRRLATTGQSFFLAHGLYRPHLPFYAPQRYWDLYKRDEIDLAPNRERPRDAPDALRGSDEYLTYHLGDYTEGTDDFHRLMRHGYFASTSYADKLVGDVLAELDRLGLAENTIVVVWGDHGWHLGDHGFWGKHNTLRQAVRVPLLVRAPGMTGGVTAPGLVETIDILSTLCDLAGLAPPASAQGRSFAPLLSEPTTQLRSSIYTRFKAADTLIMADHAYTRYEDGSEMLYDWRSDALETRNIIHDPAYADILVRLRAELADRQTEALNAKVAAPRAPAMEPLSGTSLRP